MTLPVEYTPSGLPVPGQGRCSVCGHGSMIHGANRCHYADDHDGYCPCDGYSRVAPGAVTAVGAVAVREELARLRSDLAALKAQPFVPLADHRRVIEQRDQALQSLDGMTREIARERDKAKSVAAAQAMAHLVAVMHTLRKETSGMEDEAVRNDARAYLVEQGHRAPEAEEMRRHAEEWLERKGQR